MRTVYKGFKYIKMRWEIGCLIKDKMTLFTRITFALFGTVTCENETTSTLSPDEIKERLKHENP